jgi:hypothetical protein
VPLGPGEPTWDKLYEALALLAEECGGAFAFVTDAGNGLWCVADPTLMPTASTPREDRAADRFYRSELEPRLAAMRRGSKIEVARVDGDDRYVASSFANIYALVVWFEGSFEPAFVRRRIHRALPEIEALIMGLPPSGGPGADQGAGKLRA